MRGMTLCFSAVDEDFWITPPRARGRQNALTVSRRVVRITPACAGKTKRTLPDPLAPQGHPRMRGEDCPSSSVASVDFGSPPHAQGRLFRRFPDFVDERITPACAGKTRDHRGVGVMDRDHPRMRGEDHFGEDPDSVGCGSPPHARGRLAKAGVSTSDIRITPACAGKTKNLPTPGGLLSDHPRMRGEDCCSQSNCPPAPGSPPHARGRRGELGRHRLDIGITPACAGKT